jgi:disulfide bond formation protein DsbB
VDHAAVEQILSLLAFAGLAGVGITWVGALLERAGVGRLGSAIAGLVDRAEVGLALVVALTATAGSLYFSESVGYIPCVLCWFQRIAMYPLVPVLLVASIRRERTVAPYVIASAAAGLAVSIYHYQLEWFPDQASVCSTTASVPCSVIWFKHLGISTIPFLAGSAFLMIGTLMAIAWRNERRELIEDVEEGTDGRRLAGIGGMLSLSVVVGVVSAGIALIALGGHESSSDSKDGAGGGAVTTPNATAGKTVFAETGCGGCHTLAAAGSSATVGPSLDTTTLSDADLRTVIADGRGAMPAFSNQLSVQDIADVAAFVRSSNSR